MSDQLLIGFIIGLSSGVALFLIGLFGYLIFFHDERDLENYYKRTISHLYNAGILGVPKKYQHRSIIVETSHKYSKVRSRFLRTFYKVIGREVDEVTYVFEPDSAKQRAFLIKEAVKNALLSAELLDTQFVDTLVAYFAFKFASLTPVTIGAKTKSILQKDYEESPHREIVVILDDPEFNEKVVLNPPPEKKSILSELILPMVIYKSEEARASNAGFSTREQFRLLFRQSIEGIYHQEVGIIYIGTLEASHYIGLFENAIIRFPKGFIFAARGSNIEYLKYIWGKIVEKAETTWPTRFQPVDIEGRWDFGRGIVECCWKIVKLVKMPSEN